MKLNRTLLVAFTILFVLSEMAGAIPKMTYKRGNVTVLIGESWKSGVTGMEVPIGSQVKTGAGAMAEITLDNKTVIRVKPGSTMHIPAIEGNKEKKVGLLSMIVGKIWVKATKGEDLSVKTSSAIAGVRGTIFTVMVDIDGQTEVSVFDGQVAVAAPSDIARQAEVILEEAERVRVMMNQLPSAKEIFDTAAEADDFVQSIEDGSGDETKPSLSVIAPSPGQSIPGRKVHIEGNVDILSDIVIYADGEQATVISNVAGAFKNGVILPRGKHTIKIIAKTPSGVESDPIEMEVETQGSRDTTLPMLTVTAPMPNSVFEKEPVTVQGTASDNSGKVAIVIKLNGTEQTAFVPGSDGTFIVQLSDLTLGSHDLELIAEDAAGNVSPVIKIPFEFKPPVDELPPTVVITSPGPVVSELPVRLTGSASDNQQLRKVEAVFNNMPLGVIGKEDGKFDIELPTSNILAENTLTVTAVDAFDLETTVKADFKYDGAESADAASAAMIMLEPVPPQIESSVITVAGKVMGIPSNTKHTMKMVVSPSGETFTASILNPGDSFSFTVVLYNQDNTFNFDLVRDDDPDSMILATAKAGVFTTVVSSQTGDTPQDPAGAVTGAAMFMLDPIPPQVDTSVLSVSGKVMGIEPNTKHTVKLSVSPSGDIFTASVVNPGDSFSFTALLTGENNSFSFDLVRDDDPQSMVIASARADVSTTGASDSSGGATDGTAIFMLDPIPPQVDTSVLSVSGKVMGTAPNTKHTVRLNISPSGESLTASIINPGDTFSFTAILANENNTFTFDLVRDDDPMSMVIASARANVSTTAASGSGTDDPAAAAGTALFMLDPIPPQVDTSVLSVSGKVMGIVPNTKHTVRLNISPSGDSFTASVMNPGDPFSFTAVLSNENNTFVFDLVRDDDPQALVIASARATVSTTNAGGTSGADPVTAGTALFLLDTIPPQVDTSVLSVSGKVMGTAPNTKHTVKLNVSPSGDNFTASVVNPGDSFSFTTVLTGENNTLVFDLVRDDDPQSLVIASSRANVSYNTGDLTGTEPAIAGTALFMLDPIPPQVESPVLAVSGKIMGTAPSVKHTVKLVVSPSGDSFTAGIANPGDPFSFTTVLTGENNTLVFDLVRDDDPQSKVIASARASVMMGAGTAPPLTPGIAPLLVLNAPAVTDQTQIDVGVALQGGDAGASYGLVLKHNGAVIAQFSLPASGASMQQVKNLVDGANQITAEDPTGFIKPMTLTVNKIIAPTTTTMTPVLIATGPAVVNQDDKVEISISLQGGEAGTNYPLVIRLNGAQVDQLSLPAGGSARRPVAGLNPGQNKIEVGDPTGTKPPMVVTVTRIVDTTPPVIVVTSPIAGLYLTEKTAPLSFTLTKDSQVRIEVNGSVLFDGQLKQGSHTRTINVRRGPNVARFTGKDAVGNLISPVDWNFKGDDRPPKVVMIQPTGSLSLSFNQPPLRVVQTSTGYKGFLVVKGLIIDEENSPLKGVRVSLNNAKFFTPTISAGQFQVEIELNTGANTIAVTAKDDWDNESLPKISTVSVALPPKPTVVLTAPTGLKSTEASIINTTAQGVITSFIPFTATISLNGGGEVPINVTPNLAGPTPFSAPIHTSGSGTQTVRVIVTDILGRKSTATITFIAKFKPPGLPNF